MSFAQASTTLATITGFNLGSIIDYYVDLIKLILGSLIFYISELIPYIIAFIAVVSVLSLLLTARKFFKT